MREAREALLFICRIEFWRMGVFWALCLIASYLQLFWKWVTSGDTSFDDHPYPFPPASRLGRPLCIVTGASSGLGEAAACALSREGFFVVLAGWSSNSLSKTVEKIKQQNSDAQVKAFEVDLSSFESILKFTISLEQWLSDSDMHSSVQLLVNNAGILATSHRLTTEGYDQMMATNYVGSFSLTQLLLPLLSNSPLGSRIVNVTSFTHRSVFNVQVDKEAISGKHLWTSEQYPYSHIYERSKLFLLLFSYQLHRQLHSVDGSCHVSVNAADPGLVKTNLLREVPSCISGAAFVVFKLLGLLQSPEKGVRSILDAALAPQGISGAYFFGGKSRTLKSSALSCDSILAEELWTSSYELFEDLNRASKGKKKNI